MDELGRVEMPHLIFYRCRDFRLSTFAVEIRRFRAKESRKFGDTGARVVTSARVCVEDGGVKKVAAADWRSKCRHVVDTTGVEADCNLFKAKG
jgi:hypothetical protein